MSYCKVFGKDEVMFVTKEDHATPSTVELPPPEPPQGLITSDGEINWGCPCLGGMATGPCGVEFRDAFSCFHYSKADPKGSDCFEAFRAMQDCFVQYPTVYNKSSGNDEDEEEGGLNMLNLEEAEKETSTEVPSVEGTAVLNKKEN
ncbi:mitochondrial intermembrane space import and assembly protein 40-B [Bactrocera neohumeralis]|uniref:mitochondrial intermembrane space import and assembly protein 40-B n=1 Tax=Bactrocera tryoni TaxID=59916 RepID=UPI001A965789|nr:mitochondrial intermembrane space import and assembly protein 40-B [Bactrocera tryoni]XP_050338243.1 mitochondrial intermembrane space import and assembly protein 40-B [Bactrocera neohumeralis]